MFPKFKNSGNTLKNNLRQYVLIYSYSFITSNTFIITENIPSSIMHELRYKALLYLIYEASLGVIYL